MTLLFVYNANAGKINALFDMGHKLLSPSTYPCALCALTYDTFAENKIWKAFRKESHLDMQFFHRDEFESRFPKVKKVYPVVLKLDHGRLSTILDSEALNNIPNTEHLIHRLKAIL